MKPHPVILALSVLAATLHGAAPDANPVIWADVPDVAVVYAEDTYWMISTSMHLIPSMPLMKSDDLVNWKMVCYCEDGSIFDRSDEWLLQNGKNEYGRGTWASCLRFHGGYWWATTFDTRRTYVLKAKKPEGPWEHWSLPLKMHDHTLFFDDATGRVFFIHGAKNARLTEVEPDLSRIKPGGIDKVIIHGLGKPSDPGGWGEGNQMFKRGDWYYLVNITWPRGDMRQVVVHRAKTIEGPYESKGVFRCRGIAQGTIFEGRGGKWWSLLFGDRGGVGRIPYLVPVTWQDEWPVLGKEGRELEPMTEPAHTDAIPPVCASDEFDWPSDAAMPLAWQWNHQPVKDHWTTQGRKGWLRLTTDRTVSSVTEAHNTLTQRTFGPTCEAVTKLDVSGLKPGDRAGMVCLQRDYGWVGVARDDQGLRIVWQGRRDNRDLEEVSLPWNGEPVIYLRIVCDLRIKNPNNDFSRVDRMAFFFSSDGRAWSAIGETLPMPYSIPHFMGYRFGLFAYATREAGGHADFDWYRIAEGGPVQ